jgi:hypothetical protein
MVKQLDPDIDDTQDQYDDMEDYDMLEDVYYDDFIRKSRNDHRQRKENEEHEASLDNDPKAAEEIKVVKRIDPQDDGLEYDDLDYSDEAIEEDDDEEEEKIAAQFAALDGTSASKVETEPEEAVPVGSTPEKAINLFIERNKDLAMSWVDRSGAKSLLNWIQEKAKALRNDGRISIPLYSAALFVVVFLW